MNPKWEIDFYENKDMYDHLGITLDDVMMWYHKGYEHQTEMSNHIIWNVEVAAVWSDDAGILHAFTRPLGYNENEVEDNPFK